MSSPRALAILFVLVLLAVFAASFGIARALRSEPEPTSPPPAVSVQPLRLAELGSPTELPPLRPAPPPPTSTAAR
jgi:hypothetical protein